MARTTWIAMMVGILGAAALVLPAARFAVAADDEPEFPHGDFEEDCSLCHGDEGWSPAVLSREFDHAAGGFPLTGGHAGARCRHCHKTLEFGLADPSCVTCHADVHQDELGTDCERCHTPRNFIDRARMIREHSTTRFPLNGTHTSIDCEDCHVPGERGILQYVNTPWQCVSCHLEEYQSVDDPDHEETGFPTDCQFCHNTQIWSGARFNHRFIPPDAECRDCHLEDYLATTDPNHQDVNFPETCELCHNTRGWSPASYQDHDTQYFPIYSGVHRGRWDDCSDCHVNPSDYSEFSCFSCHNHSQERMDRVHEDEHEVPGYVYDSQACYACHPDGRAEDDD